MTREEVVQAALTVERWCEEHCNGFICLEKGDCPFANEACYLNNDVEPGYWRLETFLRTRGLKHD